MATQTPHLDEALEPRPEKHLSFSQIDNYRRCSWRWYLKYVLRWEDRPSLDLVRGKAGHTALERDHLRKIKTGQNITREELLDTFSDAYDGHLTELAPTDFSADDDPGKTKDDTAQVLTVYSGKAAKGINPVAVELAIDHVIPASETYDQPILTLVRLDLLDRTGIFDNKFPRSRRGVKSVEEADSSWQLSLYDDAIESVLHTEVPNLGFITFLPPSPTGREVAEVRTTRRSEEARQPAQRQARRDRVRHVIQTTQRAIDAQIFIPTDDPRTCASCPFRTRCQSSLVKDDFTAASLRKSPSS